MFLCSLVYGKYNNESYNLTFDTIGMYYYKYALPLH
jgi:plastocyanin